MGTVPATVRRFAMPKSPSRPSPPLPALPSMSRRQERVIRQRLREQIKPLSKALTDQAKSFYMAVGQAISHWSSMENRLVQITAHLLGTTEEKAGLIMYSIINRHVWLQLIDDLFVLDGTYPQSLKVWRKIAGSLRAENDIRVQLAHHSISQDQEKLSDEIAIQAYLRPSKWDVRSKSKKAKPLTMTEIVDFTGRVNAIHDRLISLLKQMNMPKASR
jgi:hypothetical protein